MLWAPELPFGINGCSAIPFIAKDPEGFFNFQIDNQFADPVYCSATAVKEMAGKLGWASPDVVERQAEENATLRARVEELEAELAEADRFQQNIDGLTRSGYMVKRAPGRPSLTRKD